jgi:hypothetical protein
MSHSRTKPRNKPNGSKRNTATAQTASIAMSVACGMIILTCTLGARQSMHENRVRDTGIPVNAIVEKIDRDHPVVLRSYSSYIVALTFRDQLQRDLHSSTLVPSIAARGLTPGNLIPIRYDPAAPDFIVGPWQSSSAPSTNVPFRFAMAGDFLVLWVLTLYATRRRPVDAVSHSGFRKHAT